jgi:hypothetical protein
MEITKWRMSEQTQPSGCVHPIAAVYFVLFYFAFAFAFSANDRVKKKVQAHLQKPSLKADLIQPSLASVAGPTFIASLLNLHLCPRRRVHGDGETSRFRWPWE